MVQKKKLDIAGGGPGGLGGGAPQAHSWLVHKLYSERSGTEYVERLSSAPVWTVFFMERTGTEYLERPFIGTGPDRNFMERVAIRNGSDRTGTDHP